MITSKELKEWGLTPGPVFKVAMDTLGKPNENFGTPEVGVSFTQMLVHPDLFVEHPLLAPIAKFLVCERASKIKKEISLNKDSCPVQIYGADIIEKEALKQIGVASKLPISIQAALMPDAHSGYGLPIGGVLATDNAVIPYAVGLDIGCRMQMSVFDIDEANLPDQDFLSSVLMDNTVFGVGCVSENIEHSVLEESAFTEIPMLKKLNLRDKARAQIATSGGGNHFCEFGITTMPNTGKPCLAILSHSGSRGVGYAIGDNYTKLAMDKCRLPKEAQELAWLSLDDEDGQEYMEAMELAGRFSKACHDIIHFKIEKALQAKRIARFENFHNFAWREIIDGRNAIVHRKGATPAGLGVVGLIPGSNTTRTYIVDGNGNADSIFSSSHGAGRAMSRKAAKEKFTMEQFRENLKNAGVILLGGSLDECSMAYKDIEKVMEYQKELVTPIGWFKPWIVRMAEESLKPWEKE